MCYKQVEENYGIFTHSCETNKNEWARADEAIGEGREKGYNKNCA